jgi:hypothetical protein
MSQSAEREKAMVAPRPKTSRARVLQFPTPAANVIRARVRHEIERVARNMERYGTPQGPKAS